MQQDCSILLATAVSPVRSEALPGRLWLRSCQLAVLADVASPLGCVQRQGELAKLLVACGPRKGSIGC